MVVVEKKTGETDKPSGYGQGKPVGYVPNKPVHEKPTKMTEDEKFIADSMLNLLHETSALLQEVVEFYNQFSNTMNENSRIVVRRVIEYLGMSANLLNRKLKLVQHSSGGDYETKALKVTETPPPEKRQFPKIDLSPHGNVIDFDINEVLHAAGEFDERSEGGHGTEDTPNEEVKLTGGVPYKEGEDTEKSIYVNKLENMVPIVLSSGNLIYRCKGCGRVFTTEKSYIKHVDDGLCKMDATTPAYAEGSKPINNNPKDVAGKKIVES